MPSYTAVSIEGGLLSPDFLETIADREGQSPKDFGLDSRRSLDYEVTRAWSDARAYWTAFRRRLARDPAESTVTITREQWVLPLLEALGYRLTYQRRAAVVDGRTYALSHRAGDGEDAPPVHIVGSEQELGSRQPSARGGMSPHALVQDYLNRSESLWGVATNGNVLRLLRDSSYFTRPTYIEFDLRQMLEGDRLDEFILLYRLAHRTRLPLGAGDAPDCLLERYHQQGIEEGGRIRAGLRDAVETAIIELGNGFLRHPKNTELRSRVTAGSLTAGELYRELLYLIYRLLFLLVAEERRLLRSGDGSDSRTSRYDEHFSLTRLRALADQPLSAPERFDDVYLGLRLLFQVLGEERFAQQLGLTALNGELFRHLPHLDSSFLDNRSALAAIAALSYFVPPNERVRRRVNYAALDVEELGSVYESLLDLQPVLAPDGAHPTFFFAHGSERKTTGSYYTRHDLVAELVNSALVPVMEARLAEAAGGDGGATPRRGEALREAQKQALLSLTVCDPACGSGHFLLAAARRLGREWAKLDTGDDEPAPEKVREGTRLAVTHCIYGVDKNPLAVDLCKVALWLEGHNPGKPLTFLDYRIRCGDSLVGVADLKVLAEGIPDEAYAAVTGDDKKVAASIKRLNKEQREGQLALGGTPNAAVAVLAAEFAALADLPSDSVSDIGVQEELYRDLLSRDDRRRLKTACDLWTAAFFTPLDEAHAGSGYGGDARIPTTGALWGYLRQPGAAYGPLLATAADLAIGQRFFHWPLEFPDVYQEGGFDVLLCNPPWERTKLQEQEFFAARDADIAAAANKAARERLIARLPQDEPSLWQEYRDELHYRECLSLFLRGSGRFPLTGRGDINTYTVFTELLRAGARPGGRAGLVVPTGIATDATTQYFFADLVQSGALVSLYDFENRQKLFPAVDSRYKFSLLTMASSRTAPPDLPSPPRRGAGHSAPPNGRGEVMSFAFFLTQPHQLRDKERVFTLTRDDFLRLNPNTKTCPIFRTRADAELTERIYRRAPILVNDETGDNPWGIRFSTMFHMSNDSHLFRTAEELHEQGYRLQGNRCLRGSEVYLPLYEAKMIHQFDHRFGTYEPVRSRTAQLPGPAPAQYADPAYVSLPWYWVPQAEVEARLRGWERQWLLGFRDIARATDERTAIFGLLPRVGVGNNAPLLLAPPSTAPQALCLTANMNSITLDYVTRQKIAGTHMNFFFVQQLPALPPDTYLSGHLRAIVPRALELVYTAWDIKPFADDLWREADEPLRKAIRAQWEANRDATGGHESNPPAWAEAAADGIPLPPFRWDEDRRAVLRAELDAYYAQLYGLDERDLRYILDPQDVYGPDFPGETFRVLKEKEMRQFGEYRTRRLVLEAWARL